MMPKGKYYEYQIKKAAMDDRFLMDDDYSPEQYEKDSIYLFREYAKYIFIKHDNA
tara:strand:- start:231 stop:395 length:165 start_codon:yes stop_codon:yes gene_type:complete